MIPRQYALVKFDFDSLPKEYHNSYPFTTNDIYIFLGEIPNMLGHCVVCDYKTGKIFGGYHTDNFIELTEEEI
jgi:hypothetical protein